jgi:hypothetical protein
LRPKHATTKHGIKNGRDHLSTYPPPLSAKNVEAACGVADPLLENGGNIGEGGRWRDQSL